MWLLRDYLKTWRGTQPGIPPKAPVIPWWVGFHCNLFPGGIGLTNRPPGDKLRTGGWRNSLSSWRALAVCLPQGAEEVADILHQQVRLLQGGEVAAAGHHRPLLDVVGAIGPLTGRAADLGGE